MTQPLAGIRIVDLTRALAGPFCTALLADLGADVIKVEGLPTGDAARSWAPFDGDESLFFASTNRNKRSIALDFRSADAKRLLARLVAGADVLVENFRPGVLAKLDLDAAQLRERHPHLVTSSVTGFGPTGPDKDAACLDQIAQGISGLMSVTGAEPDSPLRVGIPIIDLLAGVTSALATVAALAGSTRNHAGAHVQTSLLESAISAMTFQAQRYLTLGDVPVPQGNDHPSIAPYGTFRTRDLPINIGVGTETHWRAFCHILGSPDLADEPDYADGRTRLQHSDQLRTELETLLRRLPAADWISLLRRGGIPCGPIHRMDEVFHDHQVQALGLAQPIARPNGQTNTLLRGPFWLDGQPVQVRRYPPLLGQHSREILREIGITPDVASSLLAQRIVAEPNEESLR